MKGDETLLQGQDRDRLVCDSTHLRVGDIEVELAFLEDAPPLGDLLTEYLIHLKNGL